MKKLFLNSFFLTLVVALFSANSLWAQEVTFDFAANEWNHPLGAGLDADKGNIVAPLEKDGVNLVFKRCGLKASSTQKKDATGTTSPRYWDGPQVRIYKYNVLKVMAPAGKAITKIEFTPDNNKFTLSADGLDGKTWTGNTTIAKFKSTDATRLSKMVVTLADKTAETVTPTEADEKVFIDFNDPTIHTEFNVTANTAFTEDEVIIEGVRDDDDYLSTENLLTINVPYTEGEGAVTTKNGLRYASGKVTLYVRNGAITFKVDADKIIKSIKMVANMFNNATINGESVTKEQINEGWSCNSNVVTLVPGGICNISTITFTIADKPAEEAPVVTPIAPTAFDPADNSVLGSYFNAAFTAKFDEALTLDNTKVADIKLYKGSVAAENEIAPEAGAWSAQLQNSKKDLYIYSMDEYYEGIQMVTTEEGGKYLLVIPAGIVKNEAGVANAELTLTLNGPVPAIKVVSADPADNSEVTSSFPASFNITFDKDITINNAKAANVKLYIDAVGGTEIAPEAGAWTLEKQSDGKTLRIYSLDEYSEGVQYITPQPGKKYILVVPAAIVKNGDSENKEVKITLNGPAELKPTSFDPAENTTLAKSFTASFTAKFNEALTLDDTKIASIKLYEKVGETTTELTPDDAWNARLESGKKNLFIFGSDYDGFNQEFVAKEGAKYQLVIPAGIVKNAAGIKNAELTLTLNGPVPTINLVSSDPANNTKKTEAFAATFNFTFDKEITIDNSKAANVKLYVDKIGGTEIAPEAGAWTLSKESDKKTLRIFSLDEYGEGVQMITPEAGKKYILVVPAGIVTYSDAKSKEITLTLDGPELVPTVIALESSNPADGATLEAGYHAMNFELTFAEAVTTTTAKLSAGITLTKNGSKVDVDSWGTSLSNSGKTVQLYGMDMDGYTDSYKVAEGDVFVLTIAKAVFTTSTNGQNDDITITLNGPAAPIVFNPTTIEPGDGDELYKFFGNYAMPHLELTFDENIAQVLTSKPAIELRKGSADGEVLPISGWKAELVEEHPNMLTLDAWDYTAGNSIWFEAEDVDYYWVIPAGIVKNAAGGQNEQIVLKQKGIVKKLTVDSTTPAANSTIEPGNTYYQFYVTFEEDIQIVNATPNTAVFYENNVEKQPLGADEMYGGTADVWHAMKDGSKTLYLWGDDGYQMVDSFVAVDGATYKLVIPAGIVKDAAGSLNDQITIEYTCSKAAGINDVKSATDKAAERYDLNGVRINAAKKGLQIIRTADGRIFKVNVK